MRSAVLESPGRSSLPRFALVTVALLGVAKLALHLLAINHYGYFRDELYYLASTEHLGWGYVDHPPLSIAILAAVRGAFGDSLPAMRSVAVVAGIATIFATALIARQLGGGRFAQGIAALGALMSPTYLAASRYYSMNTLDLLFWAVATWLFLRALDGGRPWSWVALGMVLGLGLLNKISMLWFIAGAGVALLLTSYRRLLRGPWPWVAGLIAAGFFLPHVLWQIGNGWPTLEFMRNATSLKMVSLSPLSFLISQVVDMNLGGAPIWVAGILFGLISRGVALRRVPVWIYLATVAILLAGRSARPSYLAPAYCGLLGLGGLALERLAMAPRRHWLRPAAVTLTVATGIMAIPMALPILPVERFVRYQAALGVTQQAEERQEMGVLPQGYADMFGWEEMTALVAEAYHRLSPEERVRCRVFGQNYGEAGAIDVLGRRLGLPPAVSRHNSYWLWGPGDADCDVVIIIGGDRAVNAEYFEAIEIVGQTSSEWAMPYERGLDVSIARRPKQSLREVWPSLKSYQ